MITTPTNTRSSPFGGGPGQSSHSDRSLDATLNTRKGNIVPGILSAPDPGDFTRGQSNGHCGDVLIADLRAYETVLDLSPQFVAEQSRILDEELSAFLAEEELSSSRVEGAQLSMEKSGLLPGFETVTWSDLRMCPPWCVYGSSEVHADAFDADPDTAPHRSAEHVIHAVNGGEGIDHTGRAEVTVQVEQDRHLSDDPTIVLSVVVGGIEQFTWLTPSEAQALHQALGRLTSDTED